jgi:hypothetical protein
MEHCEKLSQTIMASLARYEPRRLGTYVYDGVWCSAILEFLGTLISGEARRIPLPRGPAAQVLSTSRLLFGSEAIELRTPTSTRLAAMLAISQVSSTYGQGDAQTVVENCGNTLILRCSGSEQGGTSAFASRLIGEREVVRRQASRGHDRDGFFGARSSRRSLQISEQQQSESAVLASELEQLPDLCGYLKSASGRSWWPVQVRLP